MLLILLVVVALALVVADMIWHRAVSLVHVAVFLLGLAALGLLLPGLR